LFFLTFVPQKRAIFDFEKRDQNDLAKRPEENEWKNRLLVEKHNKATTKIYLYINIF
jgi:hypothetical protein